MGQHQSIPLPYDSGGPVSRGIRTPTSDESELSLLATQLLSGVDAGGAAIAVQSPTDPNTMMCIARCGSAPPIGALLDINSGISGRAVRENRTLLSDDTASDPRVDKDACKRLGIRSVVAAPISRDSRCIGILEVFSRRPSGFDTAALSRIEAEAVRASVLVGERPGDIKLPDPQNWEEGPPAFNLNRAGWLSALQLAYGNVVNDQADIRPTVSSPLEFRGISSPLRHHWRWIALASVAASLAFSAPRLFHRANEPSRISRAVPSVVENTSGARLPASNFESTAALVSDATPPVRVLMAKAVGGNNAAQASLADHYATGDGVTQDRVKAAVWSVIASTNGNRLVKRSAARIASNLQPYEAGQVQFNLGTMFRDGIGTPRNLVTAYSWFSLSERTGDVRASAALLNLQQAMSSSEIAEAQRQAPELVNHFKK